MEYKDLIKNARANGVATEKAMWESIDSLNEMLCILKEEHPELYMNFMREQHEVLHGPHYDKHFAEVDVDEICYINASGEKRSGAHWSVEQISNATKGMSFPSGTTDWDKYVAFNSFFSDLCTIFEEEQILKGAYTFYFADEDAPTGKIWHYMSAMQYK